MLKILIFAAFAYVIFRVLRQVFALKAPQRRADDAGPVDEMVQDPTCLAYIPRSTAIRKKVHGKTFYFCSQECADKFKDQE